MSVSYTHLHGSAEQRGHALAPFGHETKRSLVRPHHRLGPRRKIQEGMSALQLRQEFGGTCAGKDGQAGHGGIPLCLVHAGILQTQTGV